MVWAGEVEVSEQEDRASCAEEDFVHARDPVRFVAGRRLVNTFTVDPAVEVIGSPVRCRIAS